jgi:hypothetical protein
MSGFFRVAVEMEHFSQQIVNVLHYRSAQWLPGQGNPFDDVQNTLNAVWDHISVGYLNLLNTNTRVLRLTGVGYDDGYNIVTASPLVHTVNDAGLVGQTECTGSMVCADLQFQLGEQVSIFNPLAKSLRNRGYLALGPVPEASVDNYLHLANDYVDQIEVLAQALVSDIIMLSPAVTLRPVRIHQKFGPKVLGIRPLLWRTYSDVKGYALPRTASFRRSRRSEA